MSLRVRSCGLSHVGLVRENNEDVWAELLERNFFVLADGMGGHLAGDVAARLTVDGLCEFVETSLPVEGDDQESEDLMAALREGIRKTNQKVYVRGLEKEEWNGMGSTLCCLYFCGNRVIYAHVGDSRIYRLRGSRLEQLTEDHSLVRELLAAGYINERQAARFHYKNIITRAIGTHPDVEPSLAAIEVRPKDLFLICSDGLTDQVSDDEIAEVLRGENPLQQKAQKLVQEACAAGGKDNITVVLAEVQK